MLDNTPEQSRSHLNIHEMHIAAFLIAAILLAYPLAWVQIIDPVNGFQFLPLLTPSTLTLIAIFACILRWKKLAVNLSAAKYLLAITVAFSFIATFRLIGNFGFNGEEYLSSLGYCFIPLAFYLYAEETIIFLPRIMCLVWLISVLTSIVEYITAPHIMYGIPGNYNWNATLIAISAVFLIHQLHRKLTNIAVPKQLIILFIPAAISLAIIFICTSKGTITGILAALLLYGVAIAGKYRRCLIGTIIAIGISGYAILLLRPDLIDRVIKDDVRITLWQGCSTLIRDHGFTGTSPAGFENAFAEYIPENYFLNKNAAVRHNHPHNEFLYVIAAWGIPAGLCWAALLFYPLLNLILNYPQSHKPFRLPLMLALSILLVHGAVDLVLFEWPTNYLFLCLLGLLWHTTWEPQNTSCSQCAYRRTIMAAMLTVILGLATFNLYAGFFSWSAIRYYSQKNYIAAAVAFDRACQLKSDPYIIYRSASNAYFRLHDPVMAMKHFRQLENAGHHNYANNNGIMGQILLFQGHPGEALPYLTREAVNFPLSILAHYYRSQAQIRLGMKAEAATSMQLLFNALNSKKMTLQDLQFILENPYYDLKWQEVPLRGDGRKNNNQNTPLTSR